MQDRWPEARVRLKKPADGALSVPSDLIVHRNGENEWVAISPHAAVLGEILILDANEGERPRQLPVCVVESRKFYVLGEARHLVRLQPSDVSPVLFEQQIRRG
jgi:hypothetical protein